MKNNQHKQTRAFLYLIQSRQFFMLLFQLLLIICFVAPPLSKSHMVLVCDLVMVNNSNMQKCRHTWNWSGNVFIRKACGVSILWIHS